MPAFRLKLRSLKFLSAVDAPAQSEIANAVLLKRAGAEHDVEIVARVAKTDDKLGLVFGWAFASSLDGGETPYVDVQQDAIDPEFVRAAMEFMEGGGAVDVLHDGEQDGRVIFALPITPEISAALGIESKTVGLAVAIKPSPETYARFASGELKGFSIAGSGTREPLKPEADALATEKARVEAELADVLAAKRAAVDAQAHEERAVAEMLTWCDKIAVEHGADAAREVAKRNTGSLGGWGKRWLDAADERISKAAPPTTPIEIAKRAHEDVTKALDAYNAGLESFAKSKGAAVPMSAEAFLRSAEGGALYAAYDKANRRLHEGDVEEILAALTAEIDEALADLDRDVEEFAVRHNLEPVAARQRLSKVSRTFKTKEEAVSERIRARLAAVTEAKAAAQSGLRAFNEALAEEQRAEAEAAKRAAQTPAERAIVDRVEQMAKSRGVSFAHAMSDAMRGDPATQALYQVYSDEKAARARGAA